MGLFRRKNSPSIAQLKRQASGTMKSVLELIEEVAEDLRDGITFEVEVKGQTLPIKLRIVVSEEDS